MEPMELEELDQEGDPSKYGKLALANMDVSDIALRTAKAVVSHHPVKVSLWAFGMLLVAFAGGLPVSQEAQESYSVMFQQAEVIEVRELGQQALAELEKAEAAYYTKKGWFGACDSACLKAQDRWQMARAEVERVQKHRDQVLSEARQAVGIWSAFGVQDVRKSFWAAWKSGKDFAARLTMYDAIFLVGGRDETFITFILKIVMQYVVNLTMGMIGAFFCFLYNLYCLLCSYGSTVLSGLAFFLLAVVAGLSMLATYLGGVYAAVAGGGLMLMQHAAAQQAALESGRQGRNPSRASLQYNFQNEKDIV
mmetsp:Transcript_93257/g.179204  ORF Transcript_93257/g.179204 Transcript_93257/m.179204 type:complete len:308 (+) Transcript_93257:48-971(+)